MQTRTVTLLQKPAEPQAPLKLKLLSSTVVAATQKLVNAYVAEEAETGNFIQQAEMFNSINIRIENFLRVTDAVLPGGIENFVLRLKAKNGKVYEKVIGRGGSAIVFDMEDPEADPEIQGPLRVAFENLIKGVKTLGQQSVDLLGTLVKDGAEAVGLGLLQMLRSLAQFFMQHSFTRSVPVYLVKFAVSILGWLGADTSSCSAMLDQVLRTDIGDEYAKLIIQLLDWLGDQTAAWAGERLKRIENALGKAWEGAKQAWNHLCAMFSHLFGSIVEYFAGPVVEAGKKQD